MRTRTLAALTLCLLALSGVAATTAAGAPGSGGAASEPSSLLRASDAPSVGVPASTSQATSTSPTTSPSQATATAPASQAGEATAPAGNALAAPQTGEFTRELTVEIRMQQNGDARFVLRKEYPAETEAQRSAFQDGVAEPFQEGELPLGYDTFQTVVPNVSESADREMSLANSERATFVRDGTGVIERRFTWQNFGNATDGRIVVEDAFYTSSGPWLRAIPSHFRLVLRSPEGYRVSQSEAGVSGGGQAVVWEVDDGSSEHVFQSGEFRTEFVEDTGLFDSTTLLAIGGGLLLLGVLAYLVTRRYHLGGQRGGATAADGEGATATQSAPGGVAGAESTPDDAVAGTTGQSVGATGGATAEESETADDEAGDGGADEIDPELLSDEERVERLLEQNGGRMKQASIVDETGWSNAKVSQLLSEMAENDRVDKLRIGRENLISLPVEDGTATE